MSDVLYTKNVIEEAQQHDVISEPYKETPYPFRPVKCLESDINNIAVANNYLYFTTDTKKMYLGYNNTFLPMCSSTGFFYGSKEIPPDKSGNTPNPNVTFNLALNEIEGTDIPEVDDLILNIDGCFYRVTAVSGMSVETKRLTLQGSGGGGGGESDGAPNYSITMVNTSNAFSSTATTMPIQFRLWYSAIAENYVSKVTVSRGSLAAGNLEPTPFFTMTGRFEMNNTGYLNGIDLIDYKNYFSAATAEYTLTTYDVYNTERATSFTVQLIDLSLTKDMDDLLYSSSEQWYYECDLTGATSSQIKSKNVVVSFYDENDLTTKVYSYTHELRVSDKGEIQINNINIASHLAKGKIYMVKVQAFAYLYTSEEPLPSNILTHKFAYYNSTTNTPLLLVLLPDYNEAYTNIPMQYMIVNPGNESIYDMQVSIDGNESTVLRATCNIISSYDLYFENISTKVYTLGCRVNRLNLTHTQDIVVHKYTGEIPTVDTRNLAFWLNPRGKSNSEKNRDIWQDYRKDNLTPSELNILTAQIKGVAYGDSDGWRTNEKGATYLSLISGATLKAPYFMPFKNDPTNNKGFTVEIDFEINGVIDYDSDIIKCISYDQNLNPYIGFTITGNKARFLSSRANGSNSEYGFLLDRNIVEGKRTKIAFTLEPRNEEFPMAFMYFNGVLSQAVIYSKDNDLFQDFNYIPATLEVNSSAAQVNLYGVRFYNSELAPAEILNNYTATLDTLEDREKSYKDNNIFKENKIDFNIIRDINYQLGIPYMALTGGYATDADNDKWRLKTWDASASHPNDNPGLPVGKKDYRLIDVEVHYPKNMQDKGYKDYVFINEFEGGKSMAEVEDVRPLNGGAIIYAQGTSSLEYPTKNFRLRFKKEGDWYTVRPDLAPVEIICTKADYMDSSGSHNTGAGNLIDAIYEAKAMATPGQKHFKSDKGKIVTCIKGYPCLIFYRPHATDEYEFVGKFNLNLDKATPEPFGFAHDDSDFGYLAEGEEYYQIPYDDEGEYAGEIIDYGPSEIKATVQPGEKINAIHCFEFLDNFVNVCNFLPEPKAYIEDKDGNLIPDPNAGYWNYTDTWYRTFVNKEQKRVPGWTLGFESRYPEDKVGYHDADALFPLAKWVNDLYNIRVQEEAAGLKPDAIQYIYNYTIANGAYDNSISYFLPGDTPGTYVEVVPNETDYQPGKYWIRTMVDSHFVMTSLERFKREYQCYFDKDFLITYYLITEALLMADSRVKNMMVATWGKEKRTYKSLNADGTYTEKESNNYIFYPIFYDMDTMFGLDNTGVDKFKFDAEDTQEDVFNGVDILWNFVRDALRDELAPYFNNLENNNILVEDNILPYFNERQGQIANAAMYNGDAEVKYLIPAREGYYDYLNNAQVDPGEAPYLYAAQGDRTITREYWFCNRMRFLRGKYISSLYRSGDCLEFRWYFPSVNSNNPSLAASAAAVPPDGIFNLTSVDTGYSGVMVGKNAATVTNKRFDGAQTHQLDISSAKNVNGTEAYLLGLSNLTDLGDLSTKYMQKFVLKKPINGELKLKRLQLGNPHKDYDNTYWSTSSALSFNSCKFLEYFNMQNCKSFVQSIDLSECSAIQQILLTGSGITGLSLPENGMLEELRAPASLVGLKLHSFPALTKFSMGDYDYAAAGTDKIDDTKPQYYTSNYNSLITLDIVDTPIVDTYNIILNAPRLQYYNLQNINWTITANDTKYCPVPAPTPEDKDKDYHFDTIQYYIYVEGMYVPYNDLNHPEEYTYPEVGKMYEKYTLLDAIGENIIHIPVLDYLYTDKRGVDSASPAASLSGTITIDMPGKSVNEYNIYTQYKGMYPNVTIKYSDRMQEDINKAYSVTFYSQELDDWNADFEPYYQVLHDGSMTWSVLTSQQGPNGMALENPGKEADPVNNWTFSHWVDIDNPKNEYKLNELANVMPPEGDLRLAAVYTPTTRLYTIRFVDDDGRSLLYEIQWGYDKAHSIEYIVERQTEHPEKPHFPLYFAHKAYGGALEHGRNALKGWISKQDLDNLTPGIAPALYDLATVYVEKDMSFYAYYVEEDARNVATDERCFDFTALSTRPDAGYALTPKEHYKAVLAGKITLPAAAGNKVVKQIGSSRAATLDAVFAQCVNLTDVYFAPGSVCEVIAAYTFNSSAIRNIYLPETLLTIGTYAFANCSNLKRLSLGDFSKLPDGVTSIASNAFYYSSNLELYELPRDLVDIGVSAFHSCGDGVYITKIPDNVKVLSAYSLAYCPNVSIREFGGGTSKLERLGQGCLTNCGVNLDVAITINPGIKWINPTSTIKPNSAQPSAFANYGQGKVSTIIAPTIWNIGYISGDPAYLVYEKAKDVPAQYRDANIFYVSKSIGNYAVYEGGFAEDDETTLYLPRNASFINWINYDVSWSSLN